MRVDRASRENPATQRLEAEPASKALPCLNDDYVAQFANRAAVQFDAAPTNRLRLIRFFALDQ